MSALSDATIRECLDNREIVLDPLIMDNVQPSSVDLRLRSEVSVYRHYEGGEIDPAGAGPPPAAMYDVIAFGDSGYVVHPGDFILGCTDEIIGIPSWMLARVEGKSSLGRLGLLVHATAGYIDPGWYGRITLEIGNVSRVPIRLRPLMLICQISFLTLTTAADRPYGSDGLRSRYRGQDGPTPARGNGRAING